MLNNYYIIIIIKRIIGGKALWEQSSLRTKMEVKANSQTLIQIERYTMQ